MTKITKENTPNKYVRWFVWFLQFRYVWDIQTLLEKYLPMEKVYRFLGFYLFWFLWFCMLMFILYKITGSMDFLLWFEE